MANTYSNLKIQLMATGENSTTWGDVTNVNLGTAIEEAITGSADVTFSSGNVTLTLTDTNAAQTARNLRLRCTGTTGGSTRNLVVPSIEKVYIVQNDCADSVQVKTAAGTGITVPASKTMWVFNDGVNVVDAVNYLTTLSLGTPLPVASGGTGGNTASAARTALGAAASGANSDITSLSGLTTALSIAQGGTSANTAADARTALSAAKSGANSDITSLSGLTTALSIAQGGTSANTAADARTALGVPSNSGTGATGTWSIGITGTAGNVSGTVAIVNGGTGATTAADARTNLSVSSTTEMNAAIAVAMPSGAVLPFAMSTAPSGWLKCNGAAVSRTTYATLFAAIGTTFGSGDGSTTFNVPELRAEFVRGWDDSRGVDSGRVFGSSQSDAFASHSHTVPYGPSEGDVTTSTTNGNSAFNTLSTGSTGDTETRPRNVALLYCIKT